MMGVLNMQGKQLITLDFETYCEEDITSGSWKYSRHPSCEVLCMSWALDDDVVDCWVPATATPPYWTSQEWIDANPDVYFEAHNVAFEISIWENVCVPKLGWGKIPLHRWRDSMVKCLAHGIPASLENAGETLGVSIVKDIEGKRVMQQLSKPRIPSKARPETRYMRGVCQEWDDKFDILYKYCNTDVEAQRALSKTLPDIEGIEADVFFANLMSNLRGVPIEIPSVQSSLALIDEYKLWAKREAARITNGALNSVLQVGALVEWLKDNGVMVDSVDKETVANTLKRDDLSEDVRSILEIRTSVSKSSTAKLNAMKACADPDDYRVRFCEQYHGAGTGRVAHRLIQTGNLSKPDSMIMGRAQDHYGDIGEEALIENLIRDLNTMSLEDIIKMYKDPMKLVSSVVRPLIKAGEGKKIVVADYASIESRVLFWIAGQEDALELYRKGADLYCELGKEIFKREITKADKNERSLAKAGVLAMGYGMGVDKFVITCEAWGTVITEDFARLTREAYHSRFSCVPQLWRDVEEAAKNTLISGEPHRAGRCEFSFDKDNKFLYCKLPSGRKLAYYYPKLETEIRKFKGKEQKVRRITYITAGVNGKAMRKSTWGGTLVENICQAISRDITFQVGVLGLETHGYPVYMTVHDEICAEVNKDFGSVDEFCKIITSLPEWAEGLPVEAEGYEAFRYRK
jgi:DNA polymerase bacteriophage-type